VSYSYIRELKSKNLITGFAILVSVSYLLFYYRNVGLHDGEVYLTAGHNILNGNDPYKTGETRSGTTSSLLMYLTFRPFMGFAPTSIFQILNLTGILFFLWVVMRSLGLRDNFMTLSLLTIWLSPVREMLAINQVNGIILGLLGLFLYLEDITARTKSWPLSLLSSLSLALAIDIKPHLLVIFLISRTILKQDLKIFILTVGQLILTHAIIDFYIGAVVEISWLERLRTINHSAGSVDLGDSVTIWPLIEKIFPQNAHVIALTSLIVFLTGVMISIYFSIKQNINLTFLFSLGCPGLYIYFHFYDLIPIALVFLTLVMKYGNKRFDLAIISLMIIPKEFLNIKNLCLVFMLTLYIVSVTKHQKQQRLLSNVPLFEYAIYALLCICNSILFIDERLTQSIFVTEIFFLLSGKIISKSKRFNNRDGQKPKSQSRTAGYE